ncbi:MAG TPA: LLM class F420-dependent oxidoreductase [Xanthobacteraceae bacterium]|nr:LLM class F420-dependent oxidoreductase [Xanthobacteraceae bacterium]
MKLGIVLRTTGPTPRLDMDFILEAERLGYDSAWTSEAWGGDAVTTVSWMLARTTKIKGGTGIMQMQARTPSCAAMTAMSLQALSGGRFLLGIGPSGPQVIEGWHGVAYGKPLTRTKEYVAIVRQILARERPLEHQGEHYQIPYTGPGATGLGKPLKTIMHPDPNLKIYTASIAPAGLRTAGEVADGVLPFLMSPEQAQAIVGPVREGLAAASPAKTLADFDLAPYVRIRMGDDVAACRDSIRPELALYIGGMGARAKNFYHDLVKRMGYDADAARIQDLFLSGKRQEAAAAVPDALIDECSLVGPPARIKDRLEAWKALARDNQVGTLLLAGATAESARVVAEAVL